MSRKLGMFGDKTVEHAVRACTRDARMTEREMCDELAENFASMDMSRGKLSITAERVRRIATGKKSTVPRVLDYDNFTEKSSRSCVEVVEVEDDSRSSDESPEEFSAEVGHHVSVTRTVNAGSEHSSLNRMKALFCLQEGDEIGAVGHLVKSHAVFLHSSVIHRYKKTEVRNKFYAPQEAGLKADAMKFDSKTTKIGDALKDKLSQLPEEWYVVQLTSQWNSSGLASPDGSTVNSMSPLHITVLPTGPNAPDPICITIPKLVSHEYDGVKEILKIVKNNKDDLEKYYPANVHYWTMRAKQNSNMKIAMTVVENEWLREWRILLMADPSENSRLVREMRAMIDKLIADDLSITNISPRSRWLLRKIATSACYLTKAEIARAVVQVLGDNKKLASNVIFSIFGKLASVNDLRTEKRKPLILIVDEILDQIPFESMSLLTNHPVTRFPSFHVAYAMFKEHEDTMVKGCKVVKISDEVGSFIVNPGGDLNRTEQRMKLFIDYWLPNWRGTYKTKPDETSFGKVLVDHDILMYVGHGSGIQYLAGNQIEKLRVRALALLFGCSSVKLLPVGGRFPPIGISNRYMTACSPCVLGTLWEITDGDIDKLTARFISDWIPSTAHRPWSDVDINKWASGTLKFTTTLTADRESTNEPEMLRAIANSKEVCTQHMTAAAVVVRGLPIRLV